MRQYYQKLTEYGPTGVLSYLLFCVLWLLSCLYRFGIALRNALFDCGLKSTYRASVPVVCVGNIAVGGTGKTPMVDYLLKHFLAKNQQVAVVSRGYGGSYDADMAQVNAADGALLMSAAECGDEPLLLAKRNPNARVYVARKRRFGVRAAQDAGADIILLDDGFQHRAVARDLNIVLLDAKRPFGNGQLLPAGPLREPVASLDRADVFVRTRSVIGTEQADLPGKQSFHCQHRLGKTLLSLDGESVSWEELHNQKCVAFAGIARPDDFFESLRQQGIVLSETFALDDHQGYSARLLNQIRNACHNATALITTEKDAVKLEADQLPIPCYQTQLNLEFHDSEQFERELDSLLQEKLNVSA